MKVPIETSARHIHLSRQALDVLFGEGYELKVKRFLSQPGQFACEDRVEIVGAKGSIRNVAILGPLRSNTQVEISLTDARKMGIDAVIRESGDLSGSCGCRIIGPKGVYDLKEGVIAAKRHIHMTCEDAKNIKVSDGDIVSVKINSLQRGIIFEDTVVRVSNKFSLACHIDTDEANAAGINAETWGEIIL